MAFAKFQGNWFRIDGDLSENNVILVWCDYGYKAFIMLILRVAAVLDQQKLQIKHKFIISTHLRLCVDILFYCIWCQRALIYI